MNQQQGILGCSPLDQLDMLLGLSLGVNHILEANTIISLAFPPRLRKALMACHIIALVVDPVYLVEARYLLLVYWQSELSGKRFNRSRMNTWGTRMCQASSLSRPLSHL